MVNLIKWLHGYSCNHVTVLMYKKTGFKPLKCQVLLLKRQVLPLACSENSSHHERAVFPLCVSGILKITAGSSLKELNRVANMLGNPFFLKKPSYSSENSYLCTHR